MSDDIELPDGPLNFVSAAVVADVAATRDALAARVEALQRDLDRAVETRENANTVSVRVEQENRALAARVEELEARIARALVALERGDLNPLPWARNLGARRILRGEDEDDGAPEAR